MRAGTKNMTRPLMWVALGMLLVSCGSEPPGEIHASGTVEATDADLGFLMAGRIDSIRVREGDSVAAGAEVAVLDRTELRARRSAAEAQMEAAQAVLTELERGSRPQEIAEGKAALRQAEERRDEARRDLQRVQRLFNGGAVSQETLDKATTAAGVAEAAVDQAQERVRLLEEGPRAERIAAQRATVSQARAAVAQIDAALTNGVIVIPFQGIITIRHREPGETISPGLPVLTLMDPADRWVRIYIREDRIGEVFLGQKATISSDTYPNKTYGGEVVFIADEAQFTPRNVQTTEERVKLVYAVKVQITRDPSFDLKPGLPADVTLLSSSGSGEASGGTSPSGVGSSASRMPASSPGAEPEQGR